MSTPTSTPGNKACTNTLLVDLGGTNVRFASCNPTGATPLEAGSLRRYRVADFPTLEAATRQYLDDSGAQPQGMLVAAAGRVSAEQTVKITNHAWTIDAHALQRGLGLQSVRLVNDFAAQSMAPTLLAKDQVLALGGHPLPEPGARATQTFAVIGPGTGLGVGALLVRDGHPAPLETEGGHSGFAPQTATEIELLQHLAKRYGRVSKERVLCGSGLVNVYTALCAIAGQTAEPWHPEDITRHADAGDDPCCVRAVETMVEIFGSVAGDLVLTLGAWDGVYLTGGMLQALLPWLQRGSFVTRFEAKGRFAEAMGKVPIAAMTAAESGLLGVAAIARQDNDRWLARRSQ
jgi:glucokinase